MEAHPGKHRGTSLQQRIPLLNPVGKIASWFSLVPVGHCFYTVDEVLAEMVNPFSNCFIELLKFVFSL